MRWDGRAAQDCRPVAGYEEVLVNRARSPRFPISHCMKHHPALWPRLPPRPPAPLPPPLHLSCWPGSNVPYFQKSNCVTRNPENVLKTQCLALCLQPADIVVQVFSTFVGSSTRLVVDKQAILRVLRQLVVTRLVDTLCDIIIFKIL